ncbi:MAG: hypothetical protein IPO15_11160 [Anaerolineae bacterium]|nr:hypothetical protein [Anaerolineae bacterium]
MDGTFESAWARRTDAWLAWLQTQPLAPTPLVPNVGSWITSRETTGYAAADGLMIEGFGLEADASPYPYADWQLQMNRIQAQSTAAGGSGVKPMWGCSGADVCSGVPTCSSRATAPL